jgi:uncharacterized membrane protein
MRLRTVLKYVLGVFFIAAGINHFRSPAVYVSIMPPTLPAHLALVYISGVFEVALGALLLVPATTQLAARGLILLLIAIFPANLHMATHPQLYRGISPALLWARLPLQGVLILWAYWYTRGAASAPSNIPART